MVKKWPKETETFAIQHAISRRNSSWPDIRSGKTSNTVKIGRTPHGVKIFTKLSREIYVAARQGGGDPDTNQRLNMAIQKAKSANMPNDNIERTLKKALGETKVTITRKSLRRLRSCRVAVLVEDTHGQPKPGGGRHTPHLSKQGGNSGEAGCVAWMFERKGRAHQLTEKRPIWTKTV